jgi:transcriptional regulator with XRE-family HTH domain
MSAKSSARAAAQGRRKEPAGGDVGARLRAQREQSGIGLRELARRLGISPSAISQIETGRSRPSVSTLYAIVSELGMSLDELFGGSGAGPREGAPGDGGRAEAIERTTSPSEAPEATADCPLVQRAGSRKTLELETGVHWERLTRHADRFADFLHVVYDIDGSSSQGDRFIRHTGREYGLVLSGTLEVTVGFDTFELGPGDSISFDSTLPHRLRNVGNEPARGVWFVIGRHGDQRALAFDDSLGELPEPPSHA